MGLVPFRGFEIHDTTSRVRDVLVHWKPGKLKTHQAYLDSLHAFLIKELDGPPIYTEKKLEHFSADIVVAEEVVIRIQKDLNSEKCLKDALAYLNNFKYWKGVMLMVLVGSVKDEYTEKIDDTINQINNDFEFMSNQAIVVMRR